MASRLHARAPGAETAAVMTGLVLFDSRKAARGSHRLLLHVARWAADVGSVPLDGGSAVALPVASLAPKRQQQRMDQPVVGGARIARDADDDARLRIFSRSVRCSLSHHEKTTE